jgi:hypothetical protein
VLANIHCRCVAKASHARLLKCNWRLDSCTPVRGCAVVLMSSSLPVSIGPGIVAEGGGVFQLGFGDSGSVALKGSVVL